MNTLRMRIGGTVLAAGMLLGACGGDSLTPEQEAERDSVVAEMVEAGVDKGDAECYVDKVMDKYGAENILDPDFEPADGDIGELFKLLEDCNIDLGDLTDF